MSILDLEKLVVELEYKVKSRFYGKYRGKVKDVEDTESLGRIIATVPEIYGDKDSPWALPSVPFAGPKYGILTLPKVDDGVWIEFEAGDPSRPIWTGFWWGNDELPEPGNKDIRVIVTPGGHKVVLDDENNELHLVHSKGLEIKITEDEIIINADATKITLTSDEVNINDGVLVVKK